MFPTLTLMASKRSGTWPLLLQKLRPVCFRCPSLATSTIYKFSMVEGLIRNEAEKDTMTALTAFKKHLTSKGLDFAEKV